MIESITIKFDIGVPIHDACKEAYKIAVFSDCNVEFVFNEVNVLVSKEFSMKKSVNQSVKHYYKQHLNHCSPEICNI